MKNKGFTYEDTVVACGTSLISSLGLTTDMSILAGGNSKNHDLSIMNTKSGDALNLELKLNMNAQLGGTSIQYKTSDNSLNAINPLGDNVLPVLNENNKTESYAKLVESVNDVSLIKNDGFPFTVDVEAWDKFNKNPIRKDCTTHVKYEDCTFIRNYLMSKGDNYIQIGGLGLYHVSADTLNLGTPLFDGPNKSEIETRPSGSRLSEKLNLKVRSVGLRVQYRLTDKKYWKNYKSTVNLDNPDDLKMIITKMKK